ncbi:hypothetical protein KBY76_09045 [Synechococcus sp. GreenBA-s]|nr:hypothetical protein [Synechococcus sp. GreenBA-s]
MNHLPSDDYLELQRMQRELAANRRKISELEELINEVPAIYERKFDQKLQPLVEDVRLLSERNQALREQLRHALSPAPADAAAPAAAAAAPSPPAPTPTEPTAAAQTTEELAPPAPPSQPQRRGSRNRPALWRRLPLGWPSVRWPRPSQPPRPILLALLAAAGVGVVGGVGLQQWRLHTSGAGASASRATAAGEIQPGLTLEIRSSSETWLDVRNLRGASLYVGLFSGERRFPIGQGLRLNAGKPELVTIRVDDGPERGLGHPGWWVWHSFGPDGRQRVASE